MKKTIVTCDKAPVAIGPYSQAIKACQLLFVSGQIPLDPVSGELIRGDIKVQTTQVMENLKNILDLAGSSLDNVVKTTIFLADMKDYSDVNEVYGHYFKDSYPARSTIEVSKLPKDAGVEIDAIALLKKSKS